MVMMEPELLGHLLDRHFPTLVLYARQWCAAPEDVVQEAFLKLVTQKRPPRNVVAWLYRVVRNAAISAARKASCRHRHESQAARNSEAWFLAGPNHILDAEEATQALQSLPVESREVIVAHLWGELTFEQIAEVVGCSSSTAHRRYLQGIDILRERLQSECPQNENKKS